jgi:hypothetical protein
MRRMRTRILAFVLSGSAAFAVPAALAPAPAHAWTCDPDLRTACAVAATAICTVVAKGQPCIY